MTTEPVKQILQRLDLLESKLAFQENTIEDLNQALIIQQLEIGKMRNLLRFFSEKLKTTQASQIALPSEEAPPPHY